MAHALAEGALARDSVCDLDLLERTPLQREPFDFIVVPGFLRAAALEAVLRDFPDIPGPGNNDPEGLRYGPAFARLLDELQSDEMAARVGRKFGLDLGDCVPSIGIRGFSEPTDGNIHTDHRSKLVTLLIYFNREWPHEGGRLRMCRNDHDIEDYAADVAPLAGTMLAFRRTDHSFHGHKPHDGERKMLQLSWVQQSLVTKVERQLSRISKPVRRLLNVS
jgi:hypothetical protein